jgi:cytochrome b561
VTVRNTPDAWGWPARALHWAMAALILFLLGLGFVMANLVDDLMQRFAMTQLHKSFGFVAFVLALARIGWRAANPTPREAPGSALAARAARAAHLALYALMLWMPLTGWLMASASTLQDMYGIQNMVFGLFTLPDPFVPGDKALEEALAAAHLAGGLALSALVAVHAAAALAHHFVFRDDTLRRMVRG